jgi:outer membrane autotransporter protein
MRYKGNLQRKALKGLTLKGYAIRLAVLGTVLSLMLLVIEHQAYAACADNGGGNITCSGTTDNAVPLTGAITLDNASGDVILNNLPNVLITNDRGADSLGPTNTMQTNGNGNVTISNSGLINVDREAVYDINGVEIVPKVVVDPTLFSNDANGQLLNNGVTVGLAAAVSFDANTPLITINTLYDTNPNLNAPRTFYGSIRVSGDFTSAIYGNALSVVVNNQGGIINDSFSRATGDTLVEGHWGIANFGNGMTVINNTGLLPGFSSLYGDIILIDRDPLKEAAQRLDPSLQLAYGANQVGPRNSVINNGGTLVGNIYLGSGEHVINNAATGVITGNIYVDQKDAEIVDVNGGVATVTGTVAGNRKFTLNSSGSIGQGGPTEIRINDVAGAVNTLNFEFGISPNPNDVFPSTGNLSFTTNIYANGSGLNSLNMNCNKPLDGAFAECDLAASVSGMDVINLNGVAWRAITPGNFIQSDGDININTRLTNLYTLTANNIVVNQGATLQGVLGPEFLDPIFAVDDEIGSINGNLINRGVIRVGTAKLSVTGNAQFEAGSFFNIRIRPGKNGSLDIVGGNGIFNSNATVVPVVSQLFVRDGDQFTIATNTTGSPLIQDNGGLLHFSSSDANGNIVLIAKNEIPSVLNATAAGNNAVMTLINMPSTNAGIAQLQMEVQGLSSKELQRAAERLRPEIHDGAIRMVLGNTDHILGIVDSHLFESNIANFRGESLTNDFVREIDGTVKPAKGIWAQGFGYGGTQTKRNNVDGYNLSTTGFASGADMLFGKNQNLRIGAGFSYAGGNLDNRDLTDNSRMRTDSYLGFMYGTWNMDEWFINAAVAAGRHTYDSRRIALGRVADGEHDAFQFTSKLDAGWPLRLNDDFTFVPMASVNYTRLNEGGYTETGSTVNAVAAQSKFGVDTYTTTPGTPIALKINSRSFDSIRSGIGGRLLWTLQQQGWHAGIELRGMWNHEFGDLAQDSTARFVADGSTFRSPGVKLARESFIVGSSVRLTGDDDNDQISLMASYDADIRDKYFGQTISMMLRYDFDQGASYLNRANWRKAAQQQKVASIDVNPTANDIKVMQRSIRPLPVEAMATKDAAVAQKELAVSDSINNWVNALTNKNIASYFNSYSSEFSPSDGSTRQAWERKRKFEIARIGNPTIKLSDLTVTPNGKEASAIFTQTLTDGKNREITVNAVDLIEKNGQWLIVREDSMQVPE